MNSKQIRSRKCLVIDLKEKTFETKTFNDLHKYIGGLPMALKLYEMFLTEDPVVIAIGPLNGFFPFASKTCLVTSHNGHVEDLYVGGNLSTRIRYAGLDAIVIKNSAVSPENDIPTVIEIENSSVQFKDHDCDIESLGLPGKRCVMSFDNSRLLVNDYFTCPDEIIDSKLKAKGLLAMVITGTELMNISDFSKYESLFKKILERQDELKVDQGRYPSCAGCPRGCGKSRVGEIGGDIILHSLVACQYSESIYTDIGVIFSCLNSLGHGYTHEDIENLPKLVEQTLRSLS